MTTCPRSGSTVEGCTQLCGAPVSPVKRSDATRSRVEVTRRMSVCLRPDFVILARITKVATLLFTAELLLFNNSDI